MFTRLLKSLPRLPYREDNLFASLYLMLLIGPLFFFPIITDAFGSPRFALFMILMGVSLLVFSFRKHFDVTLNYLFIGCLLGFLLFSIISTAFSIDLINSIIGYYRQANSLAVVALWVILIFLLGLVNSRDKVLSLMNMLVVSGILIAVIGVLHFFGLGIYITDTINTRPITPGLIGNQNFSAILLVGILPMIIPLLKRTQTFYGKVYFLAAGLIMITSLAIFTSRGAILGLGVSLLFALALVVMKKSTWLTKSAIVGMLGALVLMGLLFYSPARITDVRSTVLLSDFSAQSRITAWLSSVDIINSSPWHGLGLGNFVYGYRSMGIDTVYMGQQFDDAHNLYLQLGATVGVPATLLFCILLLIGLYSSYSAYLRSSTELDSLTGLAIAMGLVSVLICVSFTPLDLSSWMLLGFLLAASQFSYQHKTLNRLKYVLQKWYGKSFFITFGLVLIIFGATYMASLIYYQYGYNNYSSKNYDKALSYLNTSLTLNPLGDTHRAYIAAILIKRQAEPEQIRSVIERYLYMHPNDAEVQYTGAYLYYMLYDYSHDSTDLAKSLAHIEIYTEKQPNYAPALLRKAYLYYKAGLIEKAQQVLHESASLVTPGQNYFGYLLLAQIQLEQGNLKGMEHSLEKAYELQNSPELKFLLEIYKSGKFDSKTLPIGLPPVDIN